MLAPEFPRTFVGFPVRAPMKSPKSNTIIPATPKDFSLRHPCHDLSATRRSFAEQPSTSRCIIMDTVNLPMSWSIVVKTLPPMKSPKSNTIIPATPKDFSLRHPCHDLSATRRSFAEQPFDFTMYYNGHRESTYVLVNRRQNVAIHLSGACRIPKTAHADY